MRQDLDMTKHDEENSDNDNDEQSDDVDGEHCDDTTGMT